MALRRETGDWWKDPFERGWYPLGSIVADWKKKTAREAQSLKTILKLPKGSKILDVGCGVGRHSIALARLGYDVTGIDISPNYLNSAKALAKANKVAVRFVRCDMRKLSFKEEFDGAINLFSSFGYFKKNSDDRKVLKGILRALKPNGTFVIDNIDLDFLRKHFLPKAWMELSDGTLVLEERHPLGPKETVAKADWLFVTPSGKRTRMHSEIRGYSKEDLARLFRRAGFTRLKFHPSLASVVGNPSKLNPRLVLSGKKT